MLKHLASDWYKIKYHIFKKGFRFPQYRQQKIKNTPIRALFQPKTQTKNSISISPIWNLPSHWKSKRPLIALQYLWVFSWSSTSSFLCSIFLFRSHCVLAGITHFVLQENCMERVAGLAQSINKHDNWWYNRNFIYNTRTFNRHYNVE